MFLETEVTVKLARCGSLDILDRSFDTNGQGLVAKSGNHGMPGSGKLTVICGERIASELLRTDESS